ncbi:PREDICTED: transcriptional repressor scratch 2 [Condylura cristata]|uniref:transcriptional repressor scratch 2 n=1 Tax=Condylura cristata TaxID=143302 RepID=UPI00064311C6|nr:PREDICTED: transcriptional repressor scratch 2 [Condylura cristata]
MPRSFLVKKIKGDGFQCSGVPAPTYHPLETAYVLPGARGPPGDNGYSPHCLPPSSYDADQKPGLELAPAEPAYPPAAPEEYSDPESPQSSLSARYFRGEAAVTDSYSMDAFFISDGRPAINTPSTPPHLSSPNFPNSETLGAFSFTPIPTAYYTLTPSPSKQLKPFPIP